MYCKKCGAKNDEDARFCYKCGTELHGSDSNREEKRKSLSVKSDIEINDFQEIYIKKLKKSLLTENELEQLDVDKIYEKAKKYKIEKNEINEVISQAKQTRQKLLEYINTVYEETTDFILNDEMRDQIIICGGKVGLNESEMNHFIDQYESMNEIPEKRELYRTLKRVYINSCFKEEFQNELYGEEQGSINKETEIRKIEFWVKKVFDLNKSEKLDLRIREQLQENEIPEKISDSKERAVVEGKVRENVESVKSIIERQYANSDEKSVLCKNQMAAFIEIGAKYGLDRWDVLLLVLAETKKNGTYAREWKNLEKSFDIKVNELLGKKVILYGKEKKFEGRYFLKNYIVSLTDEVAKEIVTKVANIGDSDNNALEVMLTVVLDCSNRIHENIKKLAEELDLKEELLEAENDESELIEYNFQKYMAEKAKDIMAAAEACAGIADGVEYEKKYRELRKQSRGKWTGGGFGISGAIAGAAQAEMLNIGTGLIHSTINFLGDSYSYSKAKSKIANIVKEIRDDIRRNLYSEIGKISDTIINIIYERYPEGFWRKKTGEYEKILQSFINEENKEEYAWELLKSNPRCVETYIMIYTYCSKVETKRELVEAGKLFGIGESIESAINERLDESIAKTDIGYAPNGIELLADYIKRRYDNLNEREKKLYEEVQKQLLREKRDNYAKPASYVALFDEKNKEWNIVEAIGQQIRSVLKEVPNKFSLSEKLDSIDAEITEICENTNVLFQDMVVKYHQILEEYMQYKLTKSGRALPLDNAWKARKIRDEVSELWKLYFSDDVTEVQKNILQIKFEKELADNHELGKLKTLKKSLLSIEEDWKILNEELENKYDAKIELEKRTVYDYYTDYQYGQTLRANLIVKEKGILCENTDKAERLKKALDSICKIYTECDMESYDMVLECLKQSEKICQDFGIGKDIVEEFKSRVVQLDLQRRTVLGKIYDTVEEADQERKMVVNGNRYDTVEEANREREKIADELSRIAGIECASKLNAERLWAIKKANFVSEQAKEKEKYYEKLIMQEYAGAPVKKERFESAQNGKVIFGLLGVVSVVVGIIPFFAGGWIAKIIIGIIVCYLWGTYSEDKKIIKEMDEEMIELKRIEKRFIVFDGEVILKD